MSKFYAVAKGLSGIPNIYESWSECQKQTKGFKGAIYKSFPTREQAQNFLDMQLNNCKTLEDSDNSLLTVYVDGSFKEIEGNYSYGLVAVLNDEVFYEENGIGNKEPEALALRNVSGELLGAMKAVTYAVKNDFKEINLCYDYQGIECWALGTWDRRGNIPEDYHKFMQHNLKSIKVNFIKIKGHTGVKYNEMADKLAGSAFLLYTYPDELITPIKEAIKQQNKEIGIISQEHTFTESSKDGDIESLKRRIQSLEKENKKLKKDNAILLGKLD